MGEARRGRGGKEKEVREVSRSGRERGGVREGEGSLAGSRKVSGRGDGGGGGERRNKIAFSNFYTLKSHRTS